MIKQSLKKEYSQIVRHVKMIGLFLFISKGIIAQGIQISESDLPPFTPQNIIDNVFLGNGVEVTNITFDGVSSAVGVFSNGSADVSLERGIVLSTGRITELPQAGSPNYFGSGTSDDQITDTDLENLVPGATVSDIVSYEITFIPISDTLRFRYAFGSDEYPEFVCSDFNDVFGFFISGPRPGGGNYDAENIAKIPDPGDPSGFTFTDFPVTINSVNGGQPGDADGNGMPEGDCSAVNQSLDFANYFNNNSNSSTLILDGILDVFVAEAVVIPCREYTIKIAIGDVEDTVEDSAVFLEAKSFGTNTVQIDRITNSIDGTIAEGCADAVVKFELPFAKASSTSIPYTILNSAPGVTMATQGQDYTIDSPDVTIPAGSKISFLTIQAILDAEVEDREAIFLEIQRDICNTDTIKLFIEDDRLSTDVFLPMDTSLCESSDLLIEPQYSPGFTPAQNPLFINQDGMQVISDNSATETCITISGVEPLILNESSIERICIDTLLHRSLSDLNIYLQSPAGKIVELSTKNGVNSGAVSAGLYQTCFTIDATQEINNGIGDGSPVLPSNPNYTGEFLPEGDLTDLWSSGSDPINGKWTLILFDDQAGITGTLTSWSMEVASPYSIDYFWSPNQGLSCSSCETPVASPTMEMTYNLEMVDSYGCASASDNITVTPGDGLDSPMVTCAVVNGFDGTFTWTEVADAVSYEVQFHQDTEWTDVGLDLGYTMTGLNPDTEYGFKVRSVGGQCPSLPDSCTFRTDFCVPADFNIEIRDASSSCSNDGQISLVDIINNGGPSSNPLIYLLDDDPQPSSIFPNLRGGEYKVNIRDANGCTTRDTFVTVQQPQKLVTSHFVFRDNLSCFGDSTGHFEVMVANGVPPYSFTLDGEPTDSIRMDLPAKSNYRLVVEDGQGCDTLIQFSITEPIALDISVTEQGETCFGANDGSALAMVSGGSQPYTFLWDDANRSTQQNVEGLVPGLYNVTVSDNNGCTAEYNNVIISSADEIESVVIGTEASCTQIADGTATTTVTGGVAPYSYIWEDGLAEADRTDLGVGKYFLTVTDMRGCTTLDSVVITPFSDVVIIPIVDEVDCTDTSTGGIEISAQNVSGNETYTWDDVMDNTSSRGDLFPGTYAVTVTDVNGCSSSQIITLDDPGGPNIQAAVVDSAKCFGESSGSIFIGITQGKPPFDYIWTESLDTLMSDTISRDKDLRGYPAGTYMLTVIDRDGCIHDKSFMLEEPDSLSLEQTLVDPISCKGDSTGNISTQVSGGTAPFAYEWSGSDGFMSDQPNLSNVPAGIYRLNVRDANNCFTPQDFTVAEPATSITIDSIPSDTICFNSTSGLLEADVFGGTGDLSFAWNTGSPLNRIINLSEGEYTLTVTDVNGCTSSAIGQVIELDSIQIDLDQNNTTCSYTTDGEAFVSYVGFGQDAKPTNDFQFEWNTSPLQTDTVAIGLEAGVSYTVLATDHIYGCKGSSSVMVGAPDPIMITEEIINVGCFGEETGSILLTTTGGNGGETYQWDASTGFQQTDNLMNLPRGQYTVSVTDQLGCFERASYNVVENSLLSISTQGIPISCAGEIDGKAQVFISGGSGEYEINWQSGDSTLVLDNLAPGTYSFELMDDSGCMIQDSIVVDDVNALGIDVQEVILPSCDDTYDGRIILQGVGGNGSYSYNVDGGNYMSNPQIIGLGPGEYVVSVKDAKGCITEFSGIQIPEQANFEVFLPSDTTVIQGADVINAADFIQGDSIQFEWFVSPEAEISCDSCASATIMDVTQDLVVTLIATNDRGCSRTQTRRIFVDSEGYVLVPTGFTPDGNGVNDVLHVYGRAGVVINNFRIYSEWGQLVYEHNNFDINDETVGWDGVFKGQPMNQDTYIWTVDATYPDGRSHQLVGNTTLIR